MKTHRRQIAAAALSLCAAFTLLTSPVSAASQATEEDIYRALEEIGMPQSFIITTRNNANSPDTYRDEDGMEMNGAYNTYDEWVRIIREEGQDGIWNAYSIATNTPVELLKQKYAEMDAQMKADPEAPAYVPPKEPEKPFAEMSLEEKRAYLDSLSEEERAEFLVHLTPEERSSLIRQLEPEQKKEIAGGLVELGQEMGMNLSVEDVDSLRFQVRDKNGRLIDSATLGTTVDPTGWNTTVPVLGGSAMILLALGGFAVMLRRTGRQEDQSNG